MHPNTAALLEFFETKHLPPHLAEISQPFGALAIKVAEELDGPEATACLRKLLEAKDCAVRAAVSAERRAHPTPDTTASSTSSPQK